MFLMRNIAQNCGIVLYDKGQNRCWGGERVNQIQEIFSEIQEMGCFFRKIRESRGVTMHSLVEQTGLSQSVISKFERGQTDIQLSSFIKLLSAMTLTLDDLCRAQVFSGFLVNELIEKAVTYQHDQAVLYDILQQLNQRPNGTRQEQVFRQILTVRLQRCNQLPAAVLLYFDQLSELLTFDALLALLAAPYLPERIKLSMESKALRSNDPHSTVFTQLIQQLNPQLQELNKGEIV